MESFEVWCWRGIERLIWTDRVKNEILHRTVEEWNILHARERRKANWRNSCHPKHNIEGKIE
jgi:hypothetical protein